MLKCDEENKLKRVDYLDETRPLLFQQNVANSSLNDEVENDFFGRYLEDPKRNLGTFTGVFVPVSLSIFGALLFLRIGFLVGNGGLLEVLLLLVISYIILLLTVTSVCAICTNGAIEGGGVYFMISRTLGPEFGGGIGFLFVIANIFSSALYISGCIESLVSNFGPKGYLLDAAIPAGRWWNYLYGSVVNLLNCIVCIIGASMFAKTNFLIFIIISICIFSVIVSILSQNFLIEVTIPISNPISSLNATGNYTGLSLKSFQDNLWPLYGSDYLSSGREVDFSTIFGVLFSGVTGIMAGANLSGNLKDPGTNIPKGTLAGLSFTFSVYAALSILSAGSCTRFLLQNNYMYLLGINLWPGFITIGAVLGTFSSSLSCLIGSSRILEAVSQDEIFGILLKPISTFKTSRGNSIFAVLTSWICVQFISLIGSLNSIALMTSVLFLLSYLAINFACMCLDLSSAPNFRPNFKYFSWHTALLGLVGSCAMMFIISSLYATVSILLCFLLIIGIHFRSPPSDWGSISQALIFHQVRKYLLLLDPRKDHVKFWRPQMLLMISSLEGCEPLITFINDLKKSGLFVLGHVKLGNLDSFVDVDPVSQEYLEWLLLIDRLRVKAFIEITLAKSVREGFHHLVRISGLGGMKPNTIIFGLPDIKKQSKISLYIDIYPVNILEPEAVNNFNNATLFLFQLACILHMVSYWKKRTILRIFLCLTSDNSNSEEKIQQLNIFLRMLRIEALVQLLHWDGTLELYKASCISSNEGFSNTERNELQMKYFQSFNTLVREHCENTAIVFFYLPPPPKNCTNYNDANQYLSMLTTLSENLPPSVFVHGVKPVVTTTL